MRYIEREIDQAAFERLVGQGFSQTIAKLFASRGIADADGLDPGMSLLLRPAAMKGCREAGELIADMVQAGRRLCVVADYDCDGATACAIMVRGLRMLGAQKDTVSYMVPDRMRDGYGLTVGIVDRVWEERKPDLIVTVDNGIASFDGVARAQELGMQVLVTDHHLPAVVDGEVKIPDANVVVNPSQPGCEFPSKAMCGAGVAFYVMLMARTVLRERGVFDAATQPRMDNLLDLVALATIADVVRLDANNRRLVANGLERMRQNRCQEGIKALFDVAGSSATQATSMDLGFKIGPRINAAGRLADMTLGIECLLTDDVERALDLAQQLHKINAERRNVGADMEEVAEAVVAKLKEFGKEACIVVHDGSFHEGVVGIVAGRIKEREHRPTFVFATSAEGALKGSGRSIPGFHLRDALDLVSKRNPGLIVKFGGHAMAAGCTVREGGLEEFREAMCQVATEWIAPEMLERTTLTDGSLNLADYNVENVRLIDSFVWGQGFEAPIFVDHARVVQQRIVGEKHLKLKLKVMGNERDAIWFNRVEPLDDICVLAYKVGVNAWNGRESVQMIVDGMVD